MEEEGTVCADIVLRCLSHAHRHRLVVEAGLLKSRLVRLETSGRKYISER